MSIRRIDTLIRVKELKDKISQIEGEMIIIKSAMEEAMKPYEEKIAELTKKKNELVEELNKIQHTLEYEKFVKNVKYTKSKMSLKELILKGNGTFADYEYYIPSGREVKPSIFLKIEKEFKNLEEFKEYLKKLIGNTKYVDYGLSGNIKKYTEARVDCYENTPVEIARKLYLNGFVIGWNGMIYVRCLNIRRRYVRHIDKIIVVKKEGKK